METAARLARAGDRALSVFAGLLILLMLLYGGYSLWDNVMTFQGAFVSGELLQFKPASTDSPDDNPTLAELQRMNPDVRAWLTIDGTHIDYPVVQGENDLEYINKDVYGEFALAGSIFMDSRNSPDFTDPYTLVYGHHMENGAMFGDIVEFVEESCFNEHPTGTLYLPDATYSITLFACIQVDAFDSVVYDPTAQTEGVAGLLERIRETAAQSREIGITAEDTIIGLSTCAEAETNGRVVLFGRLDKLSQAQEGGA